MKKCRKSGGGMDLQEHEDKLREGRKRGGRVHGEKGKDRPDRRARGGSISVDPFSEAGKVSKTDYESKTAPKSDANAKGPDRD